LVRAGVAADLAGFSVVGVTSTTDGGGQLVERPIIVFEREGDQMGRIHLFDPLNENGRSPLPLAAAADSTRS